MPRSSASVDCYQASVIPELFDLLSPQTAPSLVVRTRDRRACPNPRAGYVEERQAPRVCLVRDQGRRSPALGATRQRPSRVEPRPIGFCRRNRIAICAAGVRSGEVQHAVIGLFGQSRQTPPIEVRRSAPPTSAGPALLAGGSPGPPAENGRMKATSSCACVTTSLGPAPPSADMKANATIVAQSTIVRHASTSGSNWRGAKHGILQHSGLGRTQRAAAAFVTPIRTALRRPINNTPVHVDLRHPSGQLTMLRLPNTGVELHSLDRCAGFGVSFNSC
jgi:hypothetical protein